MRTRIFQHVSFEGPGNIAGWLRQAGSHISTTELFKGDPIPDHSEFDLLVVMGGPMSVNDEKIYPWLQAEKRCIREAIEAGKKVLGVCLGAQLIASAVGAKVYPNDEKEIGWFPVTASGSRENVFQFPRELSVFHWHGDTFDLPREAVLLASSPACKHQAFQIGDGVIGLQFHLEVTPDAVGSMISHCGNELVTQPFIQTAAQMSSAPAKLYEDANRIMTDLLGYLTKVAV